MRVFIFAHGESYGSQNDHIYRLNAHKRHKKNKLDKKLFLSIR